MSLFTSRSKWTSSLTVNNRAFEDGGAKFLRSYFSCRQLRQEAGNWSRTLLLGHNMECTDTSSSYFIFDKKQ